MSLLGLPLPNYGEALLLLLGMIVLVMALTTRTLFLGFRRPRTMQTSLPDLPFRDYADAALDESGIYSTAQCGRRRHPRTDLKALTPWTSFPNDIHNAILAIPHARTPFHIDGPTSDAFVDSELTIHHHALDTLLRPAANVLMRLGVNGRFAQPGGGNSAIVGDPDFSWITSSASQPHPKLTVEYKPWWAVDLLNLVTAFDKKL